MSEAQRRRLEHLEWVTYDPTMIQCFGEAKWAEMAAEREALRELRLLEADAPLVVGR